MRRASNTLIAVLGLVSSNAAALGTPCEQWSGTLTGNDHCTISMRICADGQRVQGTTQLRGRQSGWSERHLEGELIDRHLVAHETAIGRHRYLDGWYHCPIDRYDLQQSNDEMRGTFVSTACEDHGPVVLHRRR